MNSTLIQGELQILCLRIVKVEHLPGRWPAKNIGQRMVCSGSSSDAGIELRWAGLTLFTPFRTFFVSVKEA